MENTSLITIENDKCIIDLDKADKTSRDLIDENILRYIKFDNIHGILHELSKSGENALYQIAYWPEGGHLTNNADGTVTAVFRDEKNQILKHGRLKKVGKDLVNISKTMANQIMLVYIISQLDEINVKLDTIIRGQHDDRIAEIEGAIKTLRSLSSQDKSEIQNVSGILRQINTGISKLERELKSRLNVISPQEKRADWIPGKSKNKELESKYYYIAESISWIIKGYEALMDWDITYSINNGNNTNTENFIKFLDDEKWDQLIALARALPYSQNGVVKAPEDVWAGIKKRKPEILEQLEKQSRIKNNDVKEYIITGKKAKILEVLNEL